MTRARPRLRTPAVAGLVLALLAVAPAHASRERGGRLYVDPGFTIATTKRKVNVEHWRIQLRSRKPRYWRLDLVSREGFVTHSTAALWVRPPFEPYSVHLDGNLFPNDLPLKLPPGVHRIVFLPRFPVASAASGALPPGFVYHYEDPSYRGWPVDPVHERHPIRSGFLDTRAGGYHFGIDVAVDDTRPDPGARAPHSHRVYAVDSGTVDDDFREPRHCFQRRVTIGQFSYWHVDPVVSLGQHIRAGQFIGWTCTLNYHVHLSEWQYLPDGRRVWVNPLHLGGKVEPYSNDAPLSVGAVRFFTPAATSWRKWTDPDTAAPLSPDSLHGLVDVRARVDDGVSYLGFLGVDSKLTAPNPPYRLAIEITDAAGRIVLRRTAFEADQFPTVPYWVHFAPPTLPTLSVSECLAAPPSLDCNPPHWYRPLSRDRLEYWNTSKVPDGDYVVTVAAWDNRERVDVDRVAVTVRN